MRIIIFLISVLFTFSLTQCASFDFSRKVTQQGNLIAAEKLNRLRIGMTKEDAAILMGTSLLSPTFTNDRWDYAYTWRKSSGAITIRTAVLYFSKDKLIRIEHTP